MQALSTATAPFRAAWNRMTAEARPVTEDTLGPDRNYFTAPITGGEMATLRLQMGAHPEQALRVRNAMAQQVAATRDRASEWACSARTASDHAVQVIENATPLTCVLAPLSIITAMIPAISIVALPLALPLLVPMGRAAFDKVRSLADDVVSNHLAAKADKVAEPLGILYDMTGYKM